MQCLIGIWWFTSDLFQVFGGCFVYLSLYAVNQAQVMANRDRLSENTLIVDWNLKYWENIGSGSKIADTPIAQTCTSRAVAPGSPMLNLCQVLLLSFQSNLDFQVPILVVLSFATSFAGLCILHRFWHNLKKKSKNSCVTLFSLQDFRPFGGLFDVENIKTFLKNDFLKTSLQVPGLWSIGFRFVPHKTFLIFSFHNFQKKFLLVFHDFFGV